MKKLMLRLNREPGELILSETPPHGNVAEEDITNLGEVSLIDSKDPVTGQPNQFWTGWLFGKTAQFGNTIDLDETLGNMLYHLELERVMIIVKQEDLDEYYGSRKRRLADRQGKADTDS
jgi:hypothetical protein